MSLTITPNQPFSQQPQAQAPVSGVLPEKQEQPIIKNPIEEKEKQQSLSPQFAALARKEKMIREQRRQIEEKERLLKSRESEIENSVNSKWREKITQNPWDALIESGLTPDQVTQILLNQPKPEELELRNFRKELQELKQGQQKSLEDFNQKQEQARYNQAKQQIALEVQNLVKNDKSFELLNHYGDQAQNEVVNLIEEVFHNGIPGVYKKGYVMTVDDAAKEVEDYFVNESIDQIKKLSLMDKIKSKINPPPQPTVQKPILNKQQSTTLSNRITPLTKQFSEKERRQRAILRAQGVDPDSIQA